MNDTLHRWALGAEIPNAKKLLLLGLIRREQRHASNGARMTARTHILGPLR